MIVEVKITINVDDRYNENFCESELHNAIYSSFEERTGYEADEIEIEVYK